MGGITLGYLYLAVLGEASGYTHIYIALKQSPSQKTMWIHPNEVAQEPTLWIFLIDFTHL